MSSVVVREELDTDRQHIMAVVEAAFGGPAERDLVDALRAEDAAALSLVAEEADGIVGHVMMSVLDAPMPALALAPLAVVPDRQRTGIGSALVRAALGAAQERGWAAVVVLGDLTYYRRFGFEPEMARRFDCRYAGDHLQMKVLRGPVPPAGRIIYPAPFDRLEI